MLPEHSLPSLSDMNSLFLKKTQKNCQLKQLPVIFKMLFQTHIALGSFIGLGVYKYNTLEECQSNQCVSIGY